MPFCGGGHPPLHRLSSIDINDFAGVRLIVGVDDKIGANRVLADVIRFSIVACIVAQQMIEKAGLPFELFANRSEPVRNAALQAFHPVAQSEIVRTAHEEMNVIRHDDITADGNVE